MFAFSQKDAPKMHVVLLSFLLCLAGIAADKSDGVINPNWKKFGGRLSQLDIGHLGAVWGVDEYQHMFFLNGDKWTAINGGWKHVSPGESGVWAVNNGDQVYYRENVTLDNPMGTTWKYVRGVHLVQIDSGPFGTVFGVNKRNEVFCRKNISPKSPSGTSWKRIRIPSWYSRVKYISCGQYGCWSVTTRGNTLRSGKDCKTGSWSTITGWQKLKKVEVDPYGVAYGININDHVLVRQHVELFYKGGKFFTEIENAKFQHVSAGGQKVLALAKDGTIYQFKGGWQFTKGPSHMEQIDTGMTQEVWGVSNHNEVFRLIGSLNRWAYYGKNISYVSSGGAGVWSINLQGDVHYWTGPTIRGKEKWLTVGELKLKQIDSGPYGIVYGVNASGEVFCRVGIKPGKPLEGAWKELKNSPKLSSVSCGAFGCWGVNATGHIWYRHGVSKQDCSGTRWSRVSGNMRQIEVGANGNVCGVDNQERMYHRVGVSSANVLGTVWMLMLHNVSHVTTGDNGQYVIIDGFTYHSQDHKVLYN